MRPIETRNSDANHAVLQAQKDRWGLGHIETRYSDNKLAVLHAKTTDEGWNPQRLVILVLIALICLHKMTGEVWYTQRLVIQVQKSLFCMQKPQMSAGTNRD